MMKALTNAALALMLSVTGAAAQVLEDKPDEIQNVGIDDKRGDQIPLDLRFTDDDGQPIQLSDIFNGEQPVLLSLNYSDCPMLCGVQLNGLCDSLKQMKLTAGEDFHMVSVSINPREQPERAKQTEERYVAEYGRPGAAQGWHFLTSNERNIKELARSVGFRYQYVPKTGEFSHAAAVMVCTPDGVVSRYLYGVMYNPQTIRLSLVEAADGKVGSAMDQIILFCFHYDETKGRYGPVARNLMSVGGGLTVATVLACLLPFWLRRGSSAAEGSAQAGSAEDDAQDPPPPSEPEAT